MCHRSQMFFIESYWEYYSIKKGTSSTYLLDGKQFLHMTLYLKKTFSILLAYTSHTYSQALAIQPSVLYTTYATASHEQTCDIITFAHFEEGNLVEHKCNSDDDSNDGYISTDVLKDIQDRSKIYPEINARYTILKICYHIG